MLTDLMTPDGRQRSKKRGKPSLPHTGPIVRAAGDPDLATLLEVSQALSHEVVPERLIATVMRAVIAHAGAERGLLLLAHGDGYRIEAEAATGRDQLNVLVKQAAVTAEDLPKSVLDEVLRTKASVLLHDASSDFHARQDHYMRKHQVRSVLCTPLLREARIIGVLYLENNLSSHAFTPDRIAAVKVIGAQAALCLQNSRLCAELQERDTALAHAHRLDTLGQLLASIAHEVKQPIGAAVMNAQGALRCLDVNPPQSESVRCAITRVVNLGNRAAQIIDRIQALLKKSPPTRDWLDINEAIREVLTLLHGEVVKNNVTVRMRLAQPLPRVLGDRVQLQQVVINLIINAIEAMSRGATGLRELHIGTLQTDTHILVTLRDSGPGLAPGSQERIFEAFYTTKPAGFGIGLSICRSTIAAHGGQLWARPGESGGAVFEFTLPLVVTSTSRW
jgi:C4-dicarboxylate-specific signal transduction histidine kinase